MARGATDAAFIANHTDGFAAFEQTIAAYEPARVAAACGIAETDLRAAADHWAESASVVSVWSMGINQSIYGTAKARALINLHLLTGQIGKPGAGPFSLTGQPNAMGAREAGALCNLLPGYRLIENAEHRRELETFWNVPAGRISPTRGLNAGELIEGLERGTVEALWIVGTNPAVTMPDLARVRAALAQSPFTVLQEAYYPTETAEFAHLLLPAAQWGERAGTMTNSERTITLCAQAYAPPGESWDDLKIFAKVAEAMGFGGFSADPATVFAEFAQLTAGRPCDITGVTHEVLAAGAVQWPFTAANKRSTPRLYSDYIFHHPSGRAAFEAVEGEGVAEPPDADYPFVLTSGRVYGHWHTMTRTGKIDKANQMHPAPFVELGIDDARALGVIEGQRVELESRRGRARLAVKIAEGMTRGTVFVPMHWGRLWAAQAEVNGLTHALHCPTSMQPEFASAVRITPILDDDEG